MNNSKIKVRIPKKLYESIKLDQILREGSDTSLLDKFFARYGVDSGDIDNYFIEDLLVSLIQHFRDSAEELTNMDAKGIVDDITSAYYKLRDRSGN